MPKFMRFLPLFALLIAGCGGHHHKTVSHVPRAPVCAGHMTPYGCQAHSLTFGLPPKGLPQLILPTAERTIEMFDSVTVSAIPHGAQAVACYLNGHFANCFSMVAAFPHAYHVPITVVAVPIHPSTAKRVCLDSEPGDAPAFEVGPWVREELGLGVVPCVYANTSDMPAVKASIVTAGVSLSRVFFWLADWTFHPGLFVGYPARQWINHGPHGENYDESTVTPAFLGVNPGPVLPLCFHKREDANTCKAAKAKIASDQRAIASSQRAYAARGCPGIKQRRNWFYQHIHKSPTSKRAYRTAAYNTSVRAYVRQSCPVFGGWQGTGGRIGYFTDLVKQLEASN